MATYLTGFKHLEIQLELIKSATDDFSDSKVIGVGGFGKVYKGELSHPEGEIMVAFKRLDRKHGQGDPEFFKEIRMLSCYKHKNLISLLGFCKEGDEMILVYEFASRGSLDRILDDATLTWTQRLKICLDAAMGLSFLHDPNGSQQRILHCDIKTANILLDENLNAKISDFGLSKISPANQKYTYLVTNPVGTPGYCDPLYMHTYQLTKESDVYSFGVVLFEVLCGRVCFEYSGRKLNVFVHFWKKCYEQDKLDEIIFPDLMQRMEARSVKTFVDIAYQCLQISHEQRPTMSVVVEKLKISLELQELHDLKLQREHKQEQMRKAAEFEYGEILKLADPPLIYKSVKGLKALLSKGVPVNGGKTLLSINDKGEVICERIYIEACLDQIQFDLLQYPSGFETSRFPGGRCYFMYEDELKVHVRAEFLCPLITYSVNLVFSNAGVNVCKTLHYKLNGEAKCCMVYNTYERERRWFVVPLYQFTSDYKTADFEIKFEGVRLDCKLQIAGFEFQPLEEKVELHDQGLEEYQDIVKAVSQPLFYKSPEELKELLFKGFHINNHKTWFSLNENGDCCEMLSIADCLISREGGYIFYYTNLYSRFPRYYKTNKKGFKVHIKPQFLTPSIRYTVNLVLCNNNSSKKQMHGGLRYKLEGGTETSIVYYANETKDNHSFIAELYQFTSNGRTFDLKIVFEYHQDDLKLEGFLFQPLEKVEHEQVLEDEELSNDSPQWIMKKGLFSNLLKRFNGKEVHLGYAVDNNGNKSLMFSARDVLRDNYLSFQCLPESRFGEVAVITTRYFYIVKEIKPDVLSCETTYACYLVYKYTGDQLVLESYHTKNHNKYTGQYIYLRPPKTLIIGRKLYQSTHNPSNRTKPNSVPRQRKDGWMELKVWQFQTQSSAETIFLNFSVANLDFHSIRGLIIQSIELRPIVAHSV